MAVNPFISISIFCVCCGAVLLAVVLIVSAIFRWLKAEGAETRNKRLTMLAWIASIILLIVYISSYSGSLENLGDILVRHFKFDVGALIFIVLAAAGIVPLLLILICVIRGFQIIFKGIMGKSTTDEQPSLSSILKTPAVAATVAIGVFAFFFVIPFLIGDTGTGGAQETRSDGLLEVWMNGVEQIGSLIKEPKSNPSTGKQSTTPLFYYVLIYVIVLGVGTAAIKLLYGLILRTFKYDKEQNKLYDEYSSPIAVLIVGVSFLLALIIIEDQGIRIEEGDIWKTLGVFVQCLAMVVVLASVAVLVVELTRRVIDIRNTLIREEAGYLSIALYTQVFLLLLGLITTICSVLNSAVGGAENTRMNDIETTLKRKMTEAADKAIGEVENELKRTDQTFPPFRAKSTKK